MSYGYCATPLGNLRIEAEAGALTSVMFTDQSPLTEEVCGCPLIERAKQALTEYFAGCRPIFDLPLSPRGTLFQQRVWKALQTIPYGKTVSYSEIAHAIGMPAACRAVGKAVGANPLLILIPCHRVVRTNGELGGFSCGIERKKYLLWLESKKNVD